MYKYYCYSLTPDQYTLPEGWDSKRSYGFFTKKPFDPNFPPDGAWGHVTYERPLLMHEIWTYDLIPEDKLIRFVSQTYNDYVTVEPRLQILTFNRQVEQERLAIELQPLIKEVLRLAWANVAHFKKQGITIDHIKYTLEHGTYIDLWERWFGGEMVEVLHGSLDALSELYPKSVFRKAI